MLPPNRPFDTMPEKPPDIRLVHDGAVKIEQVAAPLASGFAVRETALEDFLADGAHDADLFVFFANPARERTCQLLKRAIEKAEGGKIIVYPTYNRDSISKLDHLEIDEYVILPVEPEDLRALAKRTINARIERQWLALDPVKRRALATSLQCFESCFSRLRDGQPLPVAEIESSCQHIREAAALGDLDQWIDALDRHHNYFFRHSMFVCGSLTFFAHAIGIRGADLDLLTVGGLLHDIGKSRVPTEILDKPGKLDEIEWEVMKKHPDYSREILLCEGDPDKIVLAMAVEHHERLDGTGYPSGLSGSRIDDHVRMTAIADVYSALIDKRAYKGSMSSEQALAIMESSRGHLDMDLLRAFKTFVLDQEGWRSGAPRESWARRVASGSS